MIYPLNAIRALALHVQGLTHPNREQIPADPAKIDQLVEQLGYVQMDTLHVVQRSHYLVLWSRLGNYQPADFDRLVYEAQQRRLFEYWAHAACIIPLKNYRFYLPRMQWYAQGKDTWNTGWLRKTGNLELVGEVLERVKKEGAVRTIDFDDPEHRSSAWWGWKPSKRALEHLYDTGEVMIAGRVHFQRVYDLRERVLPSWVDVHQPEPEEANRFFVEESVRCLGVCSPSQAGSYHYHLRQVTTKGIVAALLAEGTLVEIQAELADGQSHTLLIHRDNLPALEQAAEGSLLPERTTFLSFFDNLFWARGRDQQIWNFRNVLEAYKPAPTRIYGYFNMPILHKGRLVGRLDPKVERRNGLLRLKAIFLEPDVQIEDELLAGMILALKDFMAFHGAKELAIEHSQPAELASKLLAAF